MARKKKGILAPVIVALISMVILAIAFYYVKDFHKEKRVHYNEFGISIPGRYQIHGIDVSRYQKAIAWDLVKNMEVRGIKVGFAFIKATEGLTIKDRYFKRNWEKAKQAGIPRGAYHYFIPTESGAKQADLFIKKVKLEKGDLPPVLDIEETRNVPHDVLVQRLKHWLVIVETYYGVKPIIYSGANFYRTWLSEEFEDYPYWIAHYNTDTPRVSRQWQFWQHSERARVDGIDAYVDFNVFNGDSLQFSNLLVK